MQVDASDMAGDSLNLTPSLPKSLGPLQGSARLCLFLLFIGWTFFLYGIWQTAPVVFEGPVPLGLIAYLPWSYWAALGLLILASLLAFLDKGFNSQPMFIAILVTLGIFLIGLPALLEPNARNPDTYQNLAGLKNLLISGRIDFNQPSLGVAYTNWPGANFLLSSILNITGLEEGTQLTRYLPVVWPLYLTLVTQAIGRRLGLSPKKNFILSLLSLLSWTGFEDYPPWAISLSLYYLAIMIMLHQKGRTDRLLRLILCFAVVVSHPIVTAMLILTTLGLSLYKREMGILLPYLVITGAWYMYIAISGMEGILLGYKHFGLTQWIVPFQSQTYETVGPTPIGRLASRYASLSFTFIYLILMVWHTVWLLTHRHNREPDIGYAKLVLFMLLPLSLLALPLSPGATYGRLIVPNLVLVVVFILLTKPRRIVLSILIVLFSILLLFYRYPGEHIWASISTGMLKGAEFFATKAEPPTPSETYFTYHGVQHLVIYHNPLFDMPTMSAVTQHEPAALRFDLSRLDKVRYVLLTKQGHEAMLWSWGYDPFPEWLNTEAGKKANKLYDSGVFQVYENPKRGPPYLAQISAKRPKG